MNVQAVIVAIEQADGGFAQYVAVDASHAHDVQDSPLSDEQLASEAAADRILRA